MHCSGFTFLCLTITLYFHPPIAQLVEQTPLKRTVGGSTPSGRTRKKAGVAKLADAQALGACERKLVEVQVLSPAPILFCLTKKLGIVSSISGSPKKRSL